MKRITVTTFFYPLLVFAEVSDKVPSIQQLWLQGIMVALVLSILVRFSYWFFIVAALIVIFFGITSYETIADPYVGPAILKEQGTAYVVALFGSVVLMILGILAGWFLNYKKR